LKPSVTLVGIEQEKAMENRNSERPQNHSGAGKRLDRADLTADEAADETNDTPDVEHESQLNTGGDIGFDRVVGADEAGLGGGLDQAEEARLGVTDEELAERARRARKSDE
jgi:hypothetical protein